MPIVDGEGSNEAWESDPLHDDARLWLGFYRRFPFGSELVRHRGMWPEPDGSVTFDTRFPVATVEEYARQADRLHALVLDAMCEAFDVDERLLAVSVQHTSYWFRPHRQHETDGTWHVSPHPNGDDNAFWNDEVTEGIFGCWTGEFCVFGPGMTAALVPRLRSWLPVISDR